MTSLQHGSNVLSLWSCAAVGSLGYLSAPRHLSQAHEGLNFLHQRLRAHRRPRPMLHPAEGITPWAKGIEGRGPSLSFCLSSGGACSVENKSPRRSRRPERESRRARGTCRRTFTAAFSSKTRFPPTLPVEEPPRSGADGSREPNVDRPVVGLCLSAATAAVIRGDVAHGMDIFLQCMSRRRLKTAVGAEASTGKSRGRSSSSDGGGGGGGGKISLGRTGEIQACNKFLRSLGDAGRIDDAVVAYEAMVLSGLRPTIVTFSTLISRAGASRRVRVAERFYREMLEAGITPDVPAMNSLINAFSKAGSPDQALKVHQASAARAFDEMSSYGLAPSVITFNSLIDACARAGAIERARQVFSRMIAAGLRPNDRTFSVLIHSHARGGQVDEAFALLRDMRARGLVPNRVTYSALINACGRAGQLAKAFQTLDEMCKTGIEPNVITWTTLIDACGKGKELEWSFRLFKEMRERGTVPNSVTCSALMDACLKSGEVDLAFAVLEHMLDVGIEPTEVTYTSLLTQCARLGQADRAAVVLDKLNRKRDNSGSSRSRNSRTSSKAAPGTSVEDAKLTGDGEGVGLESEAAIAKGEEMGGSVATAVEPSDGQDRDWSVGARRIDSKLENDLLKLFGKADQVDAAFKVLEGMVARRESPDGETWLLLLNAVGTAGELDKAVALLERSRAEGHGSEINELTYSALLGACGRAKKLERAFRIVQGMRDSGVKPTEATYLALMEVCRHSRDSKAALEVFEAMETEGVRPGVRSYTSLLKVISEDNTLQTRAIQRARMLETREFPSPSSSSKPIAGSDVAASHKKDLRPPTTLGSSLERSPRLPQFYEGAVSPTGEAVEVEEQGTTQVGTRSDSSNGFSPLRSYSSLSSKLAWKTGAGGLASIRDTTPASSSSSPPRASSPTPRSAAIKSQPSAVAGISPLASSRSNSSKAPSSSTAAAASLSPASTENPALDNLFRVFLVFQEMRSRGVRPDLRAYNALVNTCADLGEFDRALGVVRQMVDDDHGGGLQPDAVTYTSLIKAAARSNPPRVEEAEEIFATMQQRTNHFSTFVQPTEVTYAHLMKASLRAGKHPRALELWRQQLSTGVAPGVRSTRVALEACAEAGDVGTALEVYKMMRASGIRPENRSLLELVNLCRANGMGDEAGRILRERSSGGASGRTMAGDLRGLHDSGKRQENTQ